MPAYASTCQHVPALASMFRELFCSFFCDVNARNPLLARREILEAFFNTKPVRSFFCDVNARNPLFVSQSQPGDILDSQRARPFFCDVNARKPLLLLSMANLTPKISKNLNPNLHMAPQTSNNSFPTPKFVSTAPDGPPQAPINKLLLGPRMIRMTILWPGHIILQIRMIASTQPYTQPYAQPDTRPSS